jgi:DNA-binding PadR family transcriptional regulator
MFEHDNQHRGFGRQRHRDPRGDLPRQLREELRRNLRHGAGHRQPSFRDIFGQGRQGPTIRRGEIRPLILTVLRQKPMHGYEVIQELEAQSGGRWRPSAGSVYPTLQQLADEGLVSSTEVDGRRTYTLTDEGRKTAEETGTRSPWAESDDEEQPDVMRLLAQLAAAVVQVRKIGSPRARSEATRVLTDARKQMYRLLSEDEDATLDDEQVDDDESVDEDEASPA